MSPALVRALRDKYVEMRRMRAAPEGDPQAAMRALAARFPGALREIDELPDEIIALRIAALDDALDGGALPRWAGLAIAYHGWLRFALRLRRGARQDRDPQRCLDSLVRSHRPAEDEPELATLTIDVISSILRPPGGRLNHWAFAQVGQEAGLDAERVEQEIFPFSVPRRA